MKKLLLAFILLPILSFGQIITTVAGGATGHGGYWGDGGPATAAQFALVPNLVVDNFGNIYVADGNNERIRKVDASTGIVHTIAGTGVAGYNGDGIPATAAQLNGPDLVFFDNSGNYYISEGYGYRIRKVDTATGTITTFAGNGTLGYSVDGTPATAASYDFAYCAFDSHNNMIYGSSHYCIRKISPSGIITTIAGTGLSGNTGDGGAATLATMVPMGGICIDKFDNIYFSDSFKSVRKINAINGIITRVAGTGDGVGYPYCCDGSAATVSHAMGMTIAVDDTGNLYLADYGNARIEKVDTFGIITTFAGTGTNGFSGDGGPATAANLNHPEGVTLDRCGNVLIGDFMNSRVREVVVNPSCSPSPLDGSLQINQYGIELISLYPNPATTSLTITSGENIKTVAITNLLGQTIYTHEYNTTKAEVDVAGLSMGMYLIRINGSEVRKFVKE